MNNRLSSMSRNPYTPTLGLGSNRPLPSPLVPAHYLKSLDATPISLKRIESRNNSSKLITKEIRKNPRLYSPAHLSLSPGPRIMIGLRNLGNTCFLNSILQCLVHIPPVFNFFSDSQQVKKEISTRGSLQGKLGASFYKLLSQMRHSTPLNSVSPNDVKHYIGKISPQFKGYNQQDAGEFLSCLLDALHSDFNRVKGQKPYREMKGDYSRGVARVADEWWAYSLQRDDSKITDIFQGQLLSVTTCHKCLHKSLSCDAFLDLALPLASDKLQDCFRAFTQPCEVGYYKCEKCARVGTCSQETSLYRLPQVLVLQIKRFNGHRKDNSPLTPPEILDTKAFATNGESAKYQLYAISHHTGSVGFGHYTSDCLDGEEWTRFDDARVISSYCPTSSSSAYILFYCRC